MSSKSNRKIFISGSWLSVANIFAGLFGYIYQIMLGRLLIPVEYSSFNAIMAITVIFISPFSSIFIIISRRISHYRSLNDRNGQVSFFLRVLTRTIIFSFISLIFVFTFQDYLLLFIGFNSEIILYLLTAIVSFSALQLINNAYFQANYFFSAFATIAVSTVILKIILSYILINQNDGIALYPLIATALAVFIVWFITTVFIWKKENDRFTLKNFDENNIDKFPYKTILPTIIATTSFAIISQIDIFFVNKFFKGDIAGHYAAAAILGKAIMYIPVGIIMAIFPVVAEDSFSNRNTGKIILYASLITFLICFSGSVFYFFFAEFIIDLLYGESYKDAAFILKWYGFSIIPLALVMVAEYYLIAKGRVLFAWLFLFVTPLEIYLMYIWHDESWQIMTTMGLSGLLLLVIGYTFVLKNFFSYKVS